MGTKVKGLFKGFKYISQIFDEPKKEAPFQIGLPTDVKHVAHIGWDDGPKANGDQSAPASEDKASKPVGDSAESDSPKKGKHSKRRSKSSQEENAASDPQAKDHSDIPKKSRRKKSKESSSSKPPKE